MYKFKDAARRGSALLGAVGLLVGVGASAIPAFTAVASADDLNPLTERSLTLSSSSPGWAYTDGSGNSTYAPPNSGANGQKTGNYFGFRVSSTATVKGLSFQYCTKSAGSCLIPGNDSTRGTDVPGSTSDLNVDYTSASEVGHSVTNGTGTITLTNGGASVVGVGTHFKSELVVGGTFITAGGHAYVIKSIADNLDLTLTDSSAAAAVAESGVAFTMTDFNQVVDTSTGLVKAVPGYTDENPKYQTNGGTGDPAEAAKNVAGNFIVMYNDAGTWTQSTGWTATASNVQNASDTATHNYITLTNSTGVALTADQQVKVLFFATGTNFITNPGIGAFFVKINDYSDNTYQNSADDFPNMPVDGVTDYTCGSKDMGVLDPGNEDCPANVIDGGVTVANVMNQSIQITTKVLETMQFSVGTVDPDTLTDAQLDDSGNGTLSHQPCDTILTGMTPSDPQDVLALGDQTSESSLSDSDTYATHSYWRLSSNSSAGATVYYSGHTLSNTSGDEIAPIGTTAKASATGAEQFGLALDTTAVDGSTGVANLDNGTYGVDYSTYGAGSNENAADNDAAGVIAANAIEDPHLSDPSHNPDPALPGDGVDDSVLLNNGATDSSSWDYSGLNASYHTPKLDPLEPTDGTNGTTNYGAGSGTIASGGTAKFAFDPLSDTVPAEIATENAQVVDCVTGKMRYIANIAATTPAGIYTTKINYIAAPQY